MPERGFEGSPGAVRPGRDARWDPALCTQKEKAHPDAVGTDRAGWIPSVFTVLKDKLSVVFFLDKD